MQIMTLLVLVILAFAALLGFTLIGFSVTVYRQQNQIKKQNKTIRHLEAVSKKPVSLPDQHSVSVAPSSDEVKTSPCKNQAKMDISISAMKSLRQPKLL